jgi:peptidoglycan/xylan/chitin deacetylase (PgdA/CDA1 family)
MKALVLAFHDIVEPGALDASGFTGPAAGRYKVDSAVFAQYLQAIAGKIRRPPESTASFAAVTNGQVPFFLTFDDGGSSALRTADLLDRFGWKGYFLVTVGLIGMPGFMSEANIRQLHAGGHVIGSHSISHPHRISSLPREELQKEWGGSVDRLSAIVGEPVRVASIPGGFYSRAVARAAASSGIGLLFTSEPTIRVHVVDGCAIVGRYAVQRGTSAETVGALASGESGARWRQTIVWNMKKPAKILGRKYYLKLRRIILTLTGGT